MILLSSGHYINYAFSTGAESDNMSFGENEYRFTAEQEEENLIKMEKEKNEVRLGNKLQKFFESSQSQKKMKTDLLKWKEKPPLKAHSVKASQCLLFKRSVINSYWTKLGIMHRSQNGGP